MKYSHELNSLNLPVGLPLDNWQKPAWPNHLAMEGQYCRLEPLSHKNHTADLFSANQLDRENRMWCYLPYGPFYSIEEYGQWIMGVEKSKDPMFFAIIDIKTEKPVGIASYLRITPEAGTIEVGHICFSPILQRTPLATEAMYLMMHTVFTRGFRRYEWKCDVLNEKSRKGAERLGFTFEGIFRQATSYKGRNRDTAWYGIIDKDWPDLDRAFKIWLNLDNFTKDFTQKQSLSKLTSPYVYQRSGDML